MAVEESDDIRCVNVFDRSGKQTAPWGPSAPGYPQLAESRAKASAAGDSAIVRINSQRRETRGGLLNHTEKLKCSGE